MKCRSCWFLLLVAGLLAGCMDDSDDFDLFASNFDFDQSSYDWEYGFADYPVGGNDNGFYELEFSYVEQVSPTIQKRALKISGNNHSDDLFMYIKKRIDGLEPDTEYTVTFEVEFASDAEIGSVGVGGSPGESVYLKVGATDTEPKTVIENDMHVMNIDKGNQSQDGEDMIVIGNIAVPPNTEGYALTLRSNAPISSAADVDKPIVARTNSLGEIWLIVGTDSGFEGVTTLYYTKISVVFSK